MGITAEHFEGTLGKAQHEPAALEITLTKQDIDRIKHVPSAQLRDFGFANADELLDSLHVHQTDSTHYMGKIDPIKPIFKIPKLGDKAPDDKPDPHDWLPDPKEVLDLSEEAKEALKAALALAVIVGVVGICASNPELIPAAARAFSVLGPALAPRAMQLAH